MSPVKTIAAALLALSAVAACSTSVTPAEIDAKLKAATLKATGSAPTVSVVLSNKQETPKRWLWNASVNGKAFSCDVDTFFELPDCQPASQTGA